MPKDPQHLRDGEVWVDCTAVQDAYAEDRQRLTAAVQLARRSLEVSQKAPPPSFDLCLDGR
jgi:hypothetical protein